MQRAFKAPDLQNRKVVLDGFTELLTSGRVLCPSALRCLATAVHTYTCKGKIQKWSQRLRKYKSQFA